MRAAEPTPERAQPLVSVGIPLYRSRPFLEIIIRNVEAIDYPNLEIIISDRHLLDDALESLKRRFGSDARFRFLEGRDRLDWVKNFNLLLREAKGKYFLWMAHDDSYPSNYVAELVRALEERPDVVLAFGRVKQTSVDGFLPTFPFSPPPISPDEEWSLGSSLRLLTLWQLWIAFRGVVRRDVVERSELYIRQTYRNIRADIYWLFGLSLTGRLHYVSSCHCTKRFHRTSAGANWRFGIRQSLNAFRVLRSYLTDLAPSRGQSLLGQVVVFLWCIAQGFLPATMARQLGIATRHLLLSRRSWAEGDAPANG
jgi:glycosyltransferase involved in cell wall biosynthesis